MMYLILLDNNWKLDSIYILGIIAFIFYFIPAVVARNKSHFTAILMLNIFLGWTILGWVGALIWAITSPLVKMKHSYTCPRCGYETTLNQKVSLYVCPQCKTESEVE